MFSSKKVLFIAASLLLVLFQNHSAHANLIKNGGFEEDTVSGSDVSSGYQYVLSLTDWTVVDNSSPLRGAVLFNSTYGQPVGDGVNSLQLEDSNDMIFQDITTVVGLDYLLSFDLSAYSSPGNATVEVGIGGVSFLFNGTSSGYETFTQVFTASASTTSISFKSLVSSGVRYPHLDNISVTSVPAPAVFGIVGLGLILMALRRKY